ncbi:MAG: YqaJ viral recombinase family protein [Verrucomicrobiota bacterium JB024]|nr:YqaJ viral recombinase family protein [Verrucomicrobiota bacterium JB024]
MKILKLIQGTEEWKAERARYHAASEAPPMMGASKKVSRNQLIEMKATGTEQEFSRWVEEVLFANGHAVEASARPIAEEIVGEELFPVVCTDDDGTLLASLDGLTMLEDIAWECKQWNEKKAAEVREGAVPEEDYWQVVQQLAVTGAEKLLYMVTDGTKEKTVYTWVTPDVDDIEMLRRGWAQFEADVAAYTPSEVVPDIVPASLVDLPAVRVQVSGSIEIADNFKVFEEALRDFIDNKLVRDPKTDQDFADLDSQIKSLKKAEEALKAAESQILSQVEAVDQAKRTKDMLATLARDNRLMAEKLLNERKKAIKVEIAQAARQAVDQHIAQINASLDGVKLPQIITDFNAAMKGKRTVATLQDAADNEMARAKIQASELADRIRANLKTLADAGHEFLFADRQQLVEKQPEDLGAVVKSRIAEHKDAEEKRLEQERARIRAEEQRKAQEQASEQCEPETPVQTSGVSEEPSPASAEQPQRQTYSASAAPRHKKPTDAEIIDAIAREFRVSEAVALRWIADIDFTAQRQALAS